VIMPHLCNLFAFYGPLLRYAPRGGMRGIVRPKIDLRNELRTHAVTSEDRFKAAHGRTETAQYNTKPG